MIVTTTAQEHLINLLNDYRGCFLTVQEFAHYHALSWEHATALLWLAREIEKEK